MVSAEGNIKRFSVTCRDTNEKAFSYKEYIETEHWRMLKEEHRRSKLSKVCHKCRSEEVFDFRLRTKKRIGNEKLIDLVPFCKTCFVEESINPKEKLNLRNVGKKKIVRRSLKPLAFNPLKLTDEEKRVLFSIEPKLRGSKIYEFYRKRTKGLGATNQWLTSQTKTTCKWVKKHC